MKHDKFIASEALYMFAAILSTLEKPLTVSKTHETSILTGMVKDFCNKYDLQNPRPDWYCSSEEEVEDET